MNKDLHNLLSELQSFADKVTKTVDKKMNEVDEAKKQLKPEERKVIKYFETKMMQAALKGDLNEVARLSKKMRERVKEVQDANTDK